MMLYRLRESKKVLLENTSSKGNQGKWFQDGIWYKMDYLGYEALSEYFVAKLLKKSNVPDYVDYDLVQIEFRDEIINGCCSRNFLCEGSEIITLERLFKRYKNVQLVNAIAGWEVHDKIKYVVNNVVEITGLEDFGKYLTMMLEIDALFLNEDRHTNNIAVLLQKDGAFDYCPIYDNGAALFSDTRFSFGMNKSLDRCYQEIEAKPFHRSFDEQLDAAEELYGQHLNCWFTNKDILELAREAVKIYPEEIVARVMDVLGMQKNKYRYLMKEI